MVNCTTLDTVDPPTIVVRGYNRIHIMWVIWIECIGNCPISYEHGAEAGECITSEGPYRIHSEVRKLKDVYNEYLDQSKKDLYNACQAKREAHGLPPNIEICAREAGISDAELVDPAKIDAAWPGIENTDRYEKSRCFCNWPLPNEGLTFGGGRRSHPEHELVKALQNKMAASFKEDQDKKGNSIFLLN